MNECEFYFSVRFYSYYSFVNEIDLTEDRAKRCFKKIALFMNHVYT